MPIKINKWIKDRTAFCLFLLLLCISAWLRFSHLRMQGIYLWDEAYFAVHARNFADFIRALVTSREMVFHQVSAAGGIWHITAAKPFHYVFLTLACLLFGGGDFSFLAVSAFFGTLSVALLYFWGRKWGQTAGLCSAALLGGMGGHIWNSRSILATVSTSFFLCLGTYLYLKDLRPKQSTLLWSGFLLGVAISTHYNALPAVGLILIFCFFRDGWRSALVLALGIFIPLCTWEILFVTRNSIALSPLPSYFGEVHRYLFEVSRRDSRETWQPALFLKWVVFSSGWPCTVLLGVGIAASVKTINFRLRNAAPEVLMVALGPGMFLFWSIASLWWAQVARPIGNLLPFLCLLAGIGWARLVEVIESRSRRRNAWSFLIPILLFTAELPIASKYRLSVSPYKAIGALLQTKPGVVATWNESLLSFYASTSTNPVYSLDPKSSEPVNTKIKYLVTDYHAPDPSQWPLWLRPWADNKPMGVLPYAGFDPRLLCMEEGVEPRICAQGNPPLGGGVQILVKS